MISQKSKESKISRCLKVPIRVLTKARNYYIQSMSQCAGGVGFASGPMGCPTPHVSSLPKSFSVNSSRLMSNDEDFRELVRIASARRLGNKVEMEILQRRQEQSSAAGVGVVPRSQGVAIGRIEEDKEYEVGDEYLKVYPRSKSCAVGKRNNISML